MGCELSRAVAKTVRAAQGFHERAKRFKKCNFRFQLVLALELFLICRMRLASRNNCNFLSNHRDLQDWHCFTVKLSRRNFHST